MRKVFLDELPRYKEGKYRGKVKWSETIGTKIPFIYKDITGEFEILKYDKNNRSVLCRYNKNECYIQCTSVLHGQIGGLFSLKKSRQ